jgi:transcription termination factor Rho
MSPILPYEYNERGTPMSEPQLERSVLEAKEREELYAIADALGTKPGSRTKKADLIAQILTATGVQSDVQEQPPEKPRRARAKKAAPTEVAAEGHEAGNGKVTETAARQATTESGGSDAETGQDAPGDASPAAGRETAEAPADAGPAPADAGNNGSVTAPDRQPAPGGQARQDRQSHQGGQQSQQGGQQGGDGRGQRDHTDRQPRFDAEPGNRRNRRRRGRDRSDRPDRPERAEGHAHLSEHSHRWTRYSALGVQPTHGLVVHLRL